MRIRSAVLEMLHATVAVCNKLSAQVGPGPGTCPFVQSKLTFLKPEIIWSRRINEILLYPI
jgi:hypothetical protein